MTHEYDTGEIERAIDGKAVQRAIAEHVRGLAKRYREEAVETIATAGARATAEEYDCATLNNQFAGLLEGVAQLIEQRRWP